MGKEKMTTRRRVLSLLGASAVTAATAIADERTHRSRWELIFNADDTEPAPLTPQPSTWSNDSITAAWIGHSTILMNFFGVNIITDPVMSSRIGLSLGGLFTIGPKRLVEPALKVSELPRIDLILLSHAHMDHLDLPTLDDFDRSIPIVMAKNTYDVIERLGFTSVREIDWGETITAAGIRIEALKVSHFGWRFPWEEDRSKGNMDGRSYNAYLLTRNGRTILFGGDTAFQEMFTAIKDRGILIDVAMMPIGAYDPWIRVHANPEQAVEMARHAGASVILPMHWNTFIQSDEPRHEPIERLHAAASAAGIAVALDTVGQTWSMEKPA
jgi:L-ascorbate metabolism protein UlaG (beta-lactamase superfamily)